MPRGPRNDIGGTTYHVLNRANNRFKIFGAYSDYLLFENLLIKAVKRFSIKLFAYNNMPNHFHLVLYSERPGHMASFMHWLSTIFAGAWHIQHGTAGTGHVFQGRYKSFPIEKDDHLLQVCLYVERNASRAALVKRAEDWRWCSAWIRINGNKKQREMLADWPIEMPERYLDVLNRADEK